MRQELSEWADHYMYTEGTYTHTYEPYYTHVNVHTVVGVQTQQRKAPYRKSKDTTTVGTNASMSTHNVLYMYKHVLA
jgi:hypothetical protein